MERIELAEDTVISAENRDNADGEAMNGPENSRSGMPGGAQVSTGHREPASSVDDRWSADPTQEQELELAALTAEVTEGTEPTCYKEATQFECWRQAMREEYHSLKRNETWQLCTYKTTEALRAKPIGCKWVYKVKRNPDGSHRYKARLVIKGYEQTNFGETFAPVAKLTSFRLLVAFAAEKDWKIDHLDVVAAFLNPVVDEDIYMELPEGADWLESDKTELSSTICKLKKALYGLKTAPRLWYRDIDTYLKLIGFIQSNADPNLYLWNDCRLLLYVDDILLAYPRSSNISHIKQLLVMKYQMTDLGTARQFLGIEIEQSHNEISINQSQYIRTVLRRFNMEDCNSVTTPLERGHMLHACDPKSVVEPAKVRLYQSILGSLMYIMLATRPDLAYTISVLGRHSVCPTTNHLTAAKRALRYLKGTSTLRLRYASEYCHDMHGFSDSDWGGDLQDRKSTGGYVFLYSGAAISWKSKKQTGVSLSTLEAEYVASSNAAKEAIWLRRLYAEITGRDTDRPTTIYLDNTGSIKNTKNQQINERTKHIDIRYHFVRHSVETGAIEVRHVPTAEMTADIMTKALPKEAHQRHVTAMGCRD